jgi:hypothetical protein
MSRMRKAVAVAAMVGGMMLAGAGAASADSNAYGEVSNSPGVLSGNLIQIPVDIPVNVCGNSVNVIGALNPAFGNKCANVEGDGQQPTWSHGWTHEDWGRDCGHHMWGLDFRKDDHCC